MEARSEQRPGEKDWGYCWNCGGRIDKPPCQCESCQQHHYLNPKPAAEVLLVKATKVLLVRRAKPPWKDHWDIPGGFCDDGEHPLETARRELYEETGQRVGELTLIGVAMDRYPINEEEEVSTLNLSYLGEPNARGESSSEHDDEVSEIGWFDLNELPEPLAFPDHIPQALAEAMRRLKGTEG